MNAHQRRTTRRECLRTMQPGTEVRLRTRRGHHNYATVVGPEIDVYGIARVHLQQSCDYGRQQRFGVLPFASIIAYRRPA